MAILINDNSLKCSMCKHNVFEKKQYVSYEIKEDGELEECYASNLLKCTRCGELNGNEKDIRRIKNKIR